MSRSERYAAGVSRNTAGASTDIDCSRPPLSPSYPSSMLLWPGILMGSPDIDSSISSAVPHNLGPGWLCPQGQCGDNKTLGSWISPGLQTPSYHPAGAWCQPSAQPHNIIVLECRKWSGWNWNIYISCCDHGHLHYWLFEGRQPHLNCILLFIFSLLMCWVAILALCSCRFSCLLIKWSSLWGSFILLLSETEVQVRGLPRQKSSHPGVFIVPGIQCLVTGWHHADMLSI